MPDASGRFKGIAVPELPWLKQAEPPRRHTHCTRDLRVGCPACDAIMMTSVQEH